MKSITLLRHAKAVPYEDGMDDYARPLNARGRDAATAIGRAGGHALPDLILCSGARRTRETWDLIRQSWSSVPAVDFSDRLYLAEPEDLLSVVEALPDRFDSVWLVGHNPGLHELALYFVRLSQGQAPFPEIERRFPTAARAVFTLAADRWRDIEHVECRFTAFIIPERNAPLLH